MVAGESQGCRTDLELFEAVQSGAVTMLWVGRTDILFNYRSLEVTQECFCLAYTDTLTVRNSGFEKVPLITKVQGFVYERTRACLIVCTVPNSQSHRLTNKSRTLQAMFIFFASFFGGLSLVFLELRWTWTSADITSRRLNG